MVELQELIVRGRLIFDGAPKRLEVFELVNGERSTKEIARKTGRGLPAVDKDLAKIRDMELIRRKKDAKEEYVERSGSIVFEKVPLVRHVPISYFNDVADTTRLVKRSFTSSGRNPKVVAVHAPTENEILDVCREGESQLYEFKAPGISTDKITKEIAGFLHTRKGGIIFYGVDDSGVIIGVDVRRQDFDQRIQNSVRNTISPSPSVQVMERKVMNSSVLLVVVPPWDRKTIYQNTLDNRYYIRRGTNIFALRPEEIRSLLHGNSLV